MKPSPTHTLFQPFTGLFLCLITVALTAVRLHAEVLVYEGFQIDGAKPSSQVGLTRDWGLFEGNAEVTVGDIDFPGLESTDGLFRLERNTVTMTQIGEINSDVVYGSFRISNETIGRDALLGIAICEPDATIVKPETSRMSLLAKGWRVNHGVAIAQGMKQKALGGAPMQAGEQHLVLFKAVNPGAENGSLTMWVLNREQVANLIEGGFDEDDMNKRALGLNALEVSQRATIELPVDKAAMIESDMILCLISRFNQGTLIDEIRFSDVSIAEAAGLNVASKPKTQKIPYVSN